MTSEQRHRLTIHVPVGDGAAMEILDPRSFDDGGLEWRLRYADTNSVRFIAAGVIASYDHLLSGEITAIEAIRRLRIMRKVRAHHGAAA